MHFGSHLHVRIHLLRASPTLTPAVAKGPQPQPHTQRVRVESFKFREVLCAARNVRSPSFPSKQCSGLKGASSTFGGHSAAGHDERKPAQATAHSAAGEFGVPLKFLSFCTLFGADMDFQMGVSFLTDFPEFSGKVAFFGAAMLGWGLFWNPTMSTVEVEGSGTP